MFNTVKVRQGCIVCHVHGDGKVEYELCIPIPKEVDFSADTKAIVNISWHNNKRYLKSELTGSLEWITYLKECVQLEVTEYKIKCLTNRKESILSKHNKVS